MKIDLQNKNILVTGASRGIGAAIAKELGTNGARVAIHYNKEKETAEAVAQSSGNTSKYLRPTCKTQITVKCYLKMF